MTTSISKPKRVWRFCARLLYVAVAVALVWLAAARWNGVPADPATAPVDEMPSRIPLDPALDRSAELIAALNAIPAEPAWTLPPPPPGMRWAGTPSKPIYPGEAIDGEWTPETRPHLQAVINYIESRSVQDALDRLARIEPGGCRVPATIHDQNRAGKLLAARARYRQMAREDVDGALDDLLTIFRLAATCYNSGTYITYIGAYGCEGLAEHQAQRLAFETHLTRAQARRITEAIESVVPSEHTLWQYQVEAEIERLQRALDASYTAEQAGNGWLVLSRLDGILGGPQPAAEPRLGAWNALSVLFNDRHTIMGKIERIRRAIEGLDDLPFKEAWSRAGALKAYSPFNLLDGPLNHVSIIEHTQSNYGYIVSATAMRRATVVAVALSAYRREHGEYPTSLEELVGDYLNAPPLDPYDNQPIRCIFKPDEDDFLLYCVGPDQTDDGGVPATPSEPGKPDKRYDRCFTHKRSDYLIDEIKLEKIKP